MIKKNIFFAGIIIVLFILAALAVFWLRNHPKEIAYNVNANFPLSNDEKTKKLTMEDSTLSQKGLSKNEVTPQAALDKKLLDHIEKDVIKDAIKIIPKEPDPGRVQLVVTMKGESIKETIDNFANFDDLSIAQNSNPGMMIAPDNGAFQARCIPRLNRVRKILEIGRENPQSVIPLLREKFISAVDGFQKSRQAFDDMVKKSGGRWAEGTWAESEPSDLAKRQTAGAATVYLLTELGDYKALPIMARMYREMKGPTNPTPRDFAVYAMYRLAKIHPRDGLTEEQLKLLNDCIETSKNLADPTELLVTPYNDLYAEYDLRIQVMNEDLGIKERRRIELRVWDLCFIDGNYVVNSADKMFKQIEEFVLSVYPDER